MKDSILIACIMVISLALGAAIASFSIDYSPADSTDPKDGRSGMKLYTDALTGRQYLSAGGGITPRLDSDNMIVCNEDSVK